MAPATVASAGPRYAPEDPTLPKPWRGLIDDTTGYLYFWNPETNITQYERPGGTSNSGAPSQQRSLAASTTTSAQVQEQFSHGKHQASSYNDNGDRHEKGDSRGSKFDSETKSYMAGKDTSNQFQIVNNGEEVTGYGGSSNKGYASAGVESGVSPESYRRKHEITVSGNNVPHPFVSFDATSLPSEILREVRYLLQGGA